MFDRFIKYLFSYNSRVAKNLNGKEIIPIEKDSEYAIMSLDDLSNYIGNNKGGAGDYVPQGPTSSTVGGLIGGTDLGTLPVTIQSILDAELYPSIGPSTTIGSTPSSGIYEKGNAQSSVSLSSTNTKHTKPITSFTYSKSGAGTIYTDPSPNPLGGSESYTDSTGVSITTTYTATVSDGSATGTSNLAFIFVAPIFYGCASPGLNVSSNGGGLTKVVQSPSSSITELYSPSNQVFYFVYDASYGALTSIKDVNNFETISDWTQSTVSITNSFGDVTTYYKYEFHNLITGSNIQYTFNR